MVNHKKEVHYRLGIWHLDLTYKTNTFRQLPLLVNYISFDEHPPAKGWMVTLKKEVYYKHGIWHIDLTNKTEFIPRMVTLQP